MDLLDRFLSVRTPLPLPYSHSCAKCRYIPGTDFRKQLWEAREIILDIKQGVCLDCVITGRESRSNEQCHEKHVGPPTLEKQDSPEK